MLALSMAQAGTDGTLSVMQECVAEARLLANPSSLSLALVPLGGFLSVLDPIQSVPVFEEAIRVGTAAGNNFAVGIAYSLLGWVYQGVGDQRAALRARRQAIDLHLAIGGGLNLVGSFVGIALMLAEFGDDEGAAVLQGAADAISLPDAPLAEIREQMLAGLRQRLGDDRLAELLAHGAAMTDDESVAYAHAKLDAVEATLPTNGELWWSHSATDSARLTTEETGSVPRSSGGQVADVCPSVPSGTFDGLRSLLERGVHRMLSYDVKPPRHYDSTRRRAFASDNRRAILEAARELFLERGFAATMMPDIASAAFVSVQTVYKAFGNKAGLAKAVFDVAIEGDDPVPMLQREVLGRIRNEPDPRRKFQLYGEHLATVAPRHVPIQLLIHSAAATDPEAGRVWRQLQDEGLRAMNLFARSLHTEGHLRAGVSAAEARDVLWTYNSAELYQLLVIERSWSPKRYGRWIAAALTCALLSSGDGDTEHSA